MIDDKIEEGPQLDYKSAGALARSDSKKAEITKDVTAFANSAGGTIVYGTREFNDEARKPRVLMAFRIHDSVVRGEIDNRIKGIVRGRIWLEGRAEPMVLELMGNAWPDLAGCVLTFNNPLKRFPDPQLDSISALQRGTIGDLTASRKVRVFDVPLEQALSMLRRNHGHSDEAQGRIGREMGWTSPHEQDHPLSYNELNQINEDLNSPPEHFPVKRLGPGQPEIDLQCRARIDGIELVRWLKRSAYSEFLDVKVSREFLNNARHGRRRQLHNKVQIMRGARGMPQ